MRSSDGKPIINDMTDLIVPAALRIWLVFLLIFVLLGYSVTASILFGAIGGFSGGMVSAWWIMPGGEPFSSDRRTRRSLLPFKLPTMRLRPERRRLGRRQR